MKTFIDSPFDRSNSNISAKYFLFYEDITVSVLHVQCCQNDEVLAL